MNKIIIELSTKKIELETGSYDRANKFVGEIQSYRGGNLYFISNDLLINKNEMIYISIKDILSIIIKKDISNNETIEEEIKNDIKVPSRRKFNCNGVIKEFVSIDEINYKDMAHGENGVYTISDLKGRGFKEIKIK